jgi:hypothetical protein
MAGISTWIWFDAAFLLLTITAIVLHTRDRKHRLPVLPESQFGRAQMLYLSLLWLMVVGNFERALVGFTAQRLVTEGAIYVVALISTLLLLFTDSRPFPAGEPLSPGQARPRAEFTRILAVGVTAAIVSIAADWAIVRAIYGDRFAGHAGLHIRFGPSATINQGERRNRAPSR